MQNINSMCQNHVKQQIYNEQEINEFNKLLLKFLFQMDDINQGRYIIQNYTILVINYGAFKYICALFLNRTVNV